MSDKYYVLYNSDGDIIIHEITKEELLKRINDGEYYGSSKYNLVSEIDTDLTASLDGLLIIKGKSIKPYEVLKVTELDVE